MTQEKDSQDKFAGLRQRAEETVSRKPKEMEDISALSPDEVRRLVHELRVHQIELEMQNEDLRQAQINLEKLKDRYLDLYDFAPVGYFTLNDKALILEANLTAVRLLGVERQTLLNRPFSRFVSKEFGDAYYLHLKKVFETQSNQTCEIELRKQDGSQFYAQLESIAVQDESGQFNQCRTVVSDITDRKRAEESLRKIGAFLDTLLNAIPAPVFYKDADGRYIGFNKSYEEFYGKTQQDLVGKSVFDIAPRELAEVYHAKDLELFRNPGIQVYDSRVKDARGAIHDVVFHKSTFSDPQGRVLGLIGVILDITERKKAEEALRESEELHRLTISSISDTVLITDDRGHFTYVCPNTHLIFGCPKEEIEPLGSITKLFDDQLFDPSQLESRGEIQNIECTIVDKFGKDHSLLVNVKRVDIKGGTVLYTCRDISDRKAAEDMLKESERRFRIIFDRAPLGIALVGLDYRLLMANKAYCDLLVLRSSINNAISLVMGVLNGQKVSES